MKTEESDKAHKARLSEGMRLIFDQETSSSHSSSRSSSQDSSYSSSQSSCSTHGPHGSRRRRHRRRSRSSSSDSDSSSDNHSRTRSRSHPRCHRASDRSRCRHRHHSPPPRRHRPHSRSFSPSPDRSYHHGRRHRAYSRSSSRSSSRGRYARRWRRSRSRSSSYRGVTKRFEGRYRCRFSPSPRRHDRSYRNRSRSLERSAVRLSQKDKMDLLNIAKENASKIIGVQNPELPASVKSMEQQTKLQEKKSESNTEELVRADPVPQKKPAQDKDVSAEDDLVRTSPSRKPITFSINNTVAKPSSSPTFHVGESKVTSRADSVGNRKPYGQWVPVKKSSNKR